MSLFDAFVMLAVVWVCVAALVVAMCRAAQIGDRDMVRRSTRVAGSRSRTAGGRPRRAARRVHVAA